MTTSPSSPLSNTTSTTTSTTTSNDLPRAAPTVPPVQTTASAEPPRPPTAPPDGRLTPRLRLILAVVLVAEVVDLMDSTITTVAAPTVARELGGGQALVSWLGASYALALGVLLVVGGRLGDRYGRRRLFLLGIAGFGAASLLCGLAVSPLMIVAARLAQGAFGALLLPQGFGILLAAFSRRQFAAAVTAFGPVLGGAAVLGPLVAGFVISADVAGLTWRPLFLVNIALCLVGLLVGRRVLPPDTDLQHDRIDVLGSGLLGLTMLALVGGLVDGSSTGWGARAWLALGAGAVLFALFCRRQARSSTPLLRPSLLTNRGFTSGLLLGLVYFAAANGFIYVVSLYLQLALGASAAHAALGLAPLTVGITAASFVARPLLGRLGRTVVLVGLLVTVAGAGLLALATVLCTPHPSALDLSPGVLALGAGMGLCFSSIYDVALGDVRNTEAGGASGALSAVQQLAGAVGIAATGGIFFGQLQHGGVQALRVGVVVVGAAALLCLGLVRLLPRHAAADEH